MKSFRAWPVIIVAVLSLTGCRSSDRPSVTPSPRVSPLHSPLATATEEAEAVVPTPASDSGVVVGVIDTEGSGDPMGGVQVFLGEPVGTDSGAPLFGLDPSSAPGIETDEQGRFAIPDVPPGDYVVILWNPTNSILARDPTTKEPMTLSVEPGEVVDVGRLSEPHP